MSSKSEPAVISSFGKKILSGTSFPYVQKLIKYRGSPDEFDPVKCPSGKILLCTAENRLTVMELFAKISSIFSTIHTKIQETSENEKEKTEESANSGAAAVDKVYNPELPLYVMNYTSSLGLPSVRGTVASFLEEYLFHNSVTISPSNLVLGAGCLAMLTSLSLLLFEPGDSILIPIPYYPAFPSDFLNYANVVVFPIDCHPYDSTDENPFGSITMAALDKAYENAVAAGHPPKGVLLSNPNNPLGTFWTAGEIMLVVGWIKDKRNMHLIMDEIYAFSVFPQYCSFPTTEESQQTTEKSENTSDRSDQPPGIKYNIYEAKSFDDLSLSSNITQPSFTPIGATTVTSATSSSASSSTVPVERFISAVELLQGSLGDYIHFVWSFSKDFGGSGLRVGCLYTQNASVLAAIATTNDTMMASNLTQYAFQQLLLDRSFLNSFLKLNSERLYESYCYIKNKCTELHIPLVEPVKGGIFVYADFRYYEIKTFEDERIFFEVLAEKVGVILTSGESCACPFPGFFRICYAFVPLSTLKVAMSRLSEYLVKIIPKI
jgi:aspartate/methionine/tyrosine aminotransferase